MSGAAEPSTEGEAGPSAEGRRLVLDIGGTKIAAGVCTPGQPSVRHRATRPTRPHRGGAAVVETALELAREVARKAGGPLAGVAAASAGVIDRATGTVASATDLMPGWAGTALGPALAEALGVPAFVLNDVHAHALGEMRFGAGAGLRNALVRSERGSAGRSSPREKSCSARGISPGTSGTSATGSARASHARAGATATLSPSPPEPASSASTAPAAGLRT